MESLSKISGMLESARELTLEAARDASSSRKAFSTPLPTAQLKKLLDSRNDREVLEGLRRVISLSYSNPDSQQSSPLFSSVLKNIASPSLAIKKLVYIYLLHHAESEPDTALLAINTVQKTMSSSDPQLRALALRVMSGIRVPVISQIVSLGIKRGVADMSPLVRKAAALAIPKCWRLDPSTSPQLVEYLSLLLGDRQYFVAGAAVIAFMEMCPERIDLIHPHYRSLVRKLVDMDEWGQLATLRLMTRYGRLCFPRRIRRVKKTDSNVHSKKDFYEDDDDNPSFEDSNSGDHEEVQIVDPDLTLFLKAAQPLLYSRNSAVIVAVARCYLYLADESYLETTIGPLVSLLRGPPETQQLALYSIVQVSLILPAPFAQYATRFLVRAKDPPETWRLKLEVLAIVFPSGPPHLQSLILSELSHFAHSRDPLLTRASVRAIGRCAQASADPATAARCLALLLGHVDAPNNYTLVSESLTIIRHLIQAAPAAHTATITRLAKNLDTNTNAQARAGIIWLVGEFSAGADDGGRGDIAADVLRILVKGFTDENEEVKAQIVLLAAKVYLHYLNGLLQGEKATGATETRHTNESAGAASSGILLKPTVITSDPSADGYSNPTAATQSESTSTEQVPLENNRSQQLHPIAKLWHHVLTLTRYDTSYDLRDRTRLYRSLLPDLTDGASPTRASTQLATLLLLAPKPAPHIPSPSETRTGFTLGSASLVIGDEGGPGGVRGYDAVPDWVEDGREPDPKMRAADEIVTGTATPAQRIALPAIEKLPDIGGWQTGGKAVGGKAKEVTLDDWLDDKDENEESETDEEEDEEEESGESEEDEEYEEVEDESEEDEESDDERDELTNLVK